MFEEKKFISQKHIGDYLDYFEYIPKYADKIPLIVLMPYQPTTAIKNELFTTKTRRNTGKKGVTPTPEKFRTLF